MGTSNYFYDGKLWKPCATVRDENSFFHSAFGDRSNEDEAYFDKHANFRRSRWLTFLTYFENETMPAALAGVLKNCFSANDKFKLKSIKDKNHLKDYALDIMAGHKVTKEEVYIISTLENIKIVLLSNEEPNRVVIVNPNAEILGNYSNDLKKPMQEIVLCMEGYDFSRLEPIGEDSASKPVKIIENDIANPQQSSSRLRRYEKGGSAGSKGVEFQVKLLTVLLLNSLRKLNRWQLSTENKIAGKFDDAVLEWPEANFLIQTKHKEKKKRITFDELLSTNSKNDDFSLPKYFISYQEIKHEFNGNNVLVICTNTDIHEKVLEFLESRRISSKSPLYCADDNCSFYKFNKKLLPRLKDSVRMYLEKNNRNRNIDQTVLTDKNLEDFLERLQFYSNYPLGNNTENVTNKLVAFLECSGNFNGQSFFQEIYGKVMEWFQHKNGVYLNEIIANAMFVEIESDRYLRKLKQYNVFFQENLFNIQDKAKLYYVNAQRAPLLQELKVYWTLRSNDSKILYANSKGGIELEKIIELFKLPLYTILIISYFQDTVDEFAISDKLGQILNRYENKKIILVAESNNKLVKEISKLVSSDCITINEPITFEDFSQDFQEKLLKKKVIFQGSDVSIQELLETETNQNWINKLSSEILEKLVLGEQIKVGIEVRPLDQNIFHYYIDRTFKKEVEGSEHDETVGRKTEEIISERKIFEVNEKVVLISDVAGMGKSTVLSHLAVTVKEKNPLKWVIPIELGSCTRILKEFKENKCEGIRIEDLLDLRRVTNLSNELENVLFSMNRKVILLIDGVDEISPDYTELVVTLLAECQKGSNFDKVFVTTRPNMAEEVESVLSVKSFTLLPFTKQHQINFLVNYWEYHLKINNVNKKKCETYATILIETTSSWTKLYQQGENHVASIPLLARMLAEVFQSVDKTEDLKDWQGCKEYLEGNETMPKLIEKSNITNIYKMFIQKKLNYFTNKGNPSGNPAAKKALVDQFEDCLAYHRILALEEILRESECEPFSHYKRKNNEKMETTILKMGIVLKLENNFLFVHRTFAEYFVADCIQIELQKPEQNYNFQKFFFDEILMNSKHIVVRAFLDGFLEIIIDNLPSNVFEKYKSLLYSIDLMPSCNLIHQLAIEGCVSVLRLLLKCIKFEVVSNTEFNLDSTQRRVVCDNSIRILQSLVQKCGVNVLNNFGKTPLSCAIQEGHLEMVKFLVEYGAIIEKRDIQSLLYKAICLNHVNIVEYLLDKYLEKFGLKEKYPIIFYAFGYLGQLDRLEDLTRENLNINTIVERGETLILGAARGRQTETVKYLIRHGADVNSTDEDGNTALHLMATNPASISIVGLLIQMGIDVNFKNFRGNTALHLAINSLNMTEFLIKSGADLNSKNENGATAINLAASGGQLEAVKLLVEYGADVNVTDNGGNSLMHSAITGGLNVVKFFLGRGLDVNVKNNNGYLPLHIAVLRGQLEIIKLFAKVGVDISRDNSGNTAIYLASLINQAHVIGCLVKLGGDVNIVCSNGFTALHKAAYNGNLESVKYLVKVGADINLRNNSDCTALHVSALKGNWHVAAFLVECYSNINIDENDRKVLLNLASSVTNVVYPYGQGSLHWAGMSGKLHIIKLLLGIGVNIDIVDQNGCTPLHLADRLDAVKFLVKHGADIYIKDNKGRTALHHAFYNSRRDVIKFFYELGVNIHITDNDNQTVLHYAARSCQWDIIKFLLYRGMDVNFRDIYGVVPIQLAVLRGSRDVLESFVKSGADMSMRDDNGRTTLHFATLSGNLEAVKFLVERGVNNYIRDNRNRTVLHFAASNCVTFLSSLRIGVNIKDDEGCTALHYGAENGDLDKIQILMQHNADLRIRNNYGQTALLLAASEKQWKVVEFLMQFDFDVNIKDSNGCTVLHFATMNGQLNIVDHVLKRGADVHLRNEDGRTALHLAALQDSTNVMGCFGYYCRANNLKSYWNIVKLLIKYGGDIYKRDFEGNTAAMLAEKTGNYHLLQYLEPKKKIEKL